MTYLQQRIFDFVQTWQIATKPMLEAQSFFEKGFFNETESTKEAIDSLVQNGHLKRVVVTIQDKESYALFPANTIFKTWS